MPFFIADIDGTTSSTGARPPGDSAPRRNAAVRSPDSSRHDSIHRDEGEFLTPPSHVWTDDESWHSADEWLLQSIEREEQIFHPYPIPDNGGIYYFEMCPREAEMPWSTSSDSLGDCELGYNGVEKEATSDVELAPTHRLVGLLTAQEDQLWSTAAFDKFAAGQTTDWPSIATNDIDTSPNPFIFDPSPDLPPPPVEYASTEDGDYINIVTPERGYNIRIKLSPRSMSPSSPASPSPLASPMISTVGCSPTLPATKLDLESSFVLPTIDVAAILAESAELLHFSLPSSPTTADDCWMAMVMEWQKEEIECYKQCAHCHMHHWQPVQDAESAISAAISCNQSDDFVQKLMRSRQGAVSDVWAEIRANCKHAAGNTWGFNPILV